MPARPDASRRGFTLIEVLVVIAIISILMVMLFPALNMLRHRAKAVTTLKMVSELGTAMDAYRLEDVRHFYPTPTTQSAYVATAPGEFLQYISNSTANPPPVLNLLETSGHYKVTKSDIDNSGQYPDALLDPWKSPILYYLDGPFMKVPAATPPFDSARMDKAKPGWVPATLTDWNKPIDEPFAYIWSVGIPKFYDTDRDPTQAASVKRWIYRKTSQ